MGHLDPDEVRTRWQALQVPGAVDALRAGREAEVTDVVWMEYGSEDHLPEPYWQQQSGRRPGRRLDRSANRATRVGVDASGRPVLAAMLDDGEVSTYDLLTWSEGRVEVLRAPTMAGWIGELRVLALDGDRPVELVSCGQQTRLDGRPAVHVVRYDYDGAGRLELALRVYESGSDRSWGPEKGPYWSSTATRFTHGVKGALALVEHVIGPQQIAHGQGSEAALAAARGGLRSERESTQVIWDGRIEAREDDLPERERAFDGVAGPLADAIGAAVAEVLERVGCLAFVVVDLDPDRSGLVRAAAAGVAYRDRARALIGHPDDVLDLAYRGSPATAELDVLGAAPPDLQRRMRAALQALEDAWEMCARMTVALATDLARELDARNWPEADAAFFALVRTDDVEWLAAEDENEEEDDVEDGFADEDDFADEDGFADEDDFEDDEDDFEDDDDDEDDFEDDDEDDDEDGQDGDDDEDGWGREPAADPRRFRASRAAVGDKRVDAFLATLAPPESAPGVVLAEKARVPDRSALVALLHNAGLQPVDADRVAADAAWAIALEPGGTGATRLGGFPVLPADIPWPTADGRPLTHLATIALGELPEVEGRAFLPPDGHLSFFADLSEAGELHESIEPGDPRERVAVVYAPEGTPTHEPSPPDGPARDEFDPPVVLRERRVQPTARLQLRHGDVGSAARRFGIDAVAEKVLEQVTHAVNGAVDHQLFGFPAVVQVDPREDGQVALLHIGPDSDLGFEFLDGGDLLFFGDAGAVRARQWDRLTVSPSSC